MATTLQPGDRVPMSWDEYLGLGPEMRGEYVDGDFVTAAAPTQRATSASPGAWPT